MGGRVVDGRGQITRLRRGEGPSVLGADDRPCGPIAPTEPLDQGFRGEPAQALL